MSFAAIEFLELLETIQVEQRKARVGHGAEVSATALHGQHARWTARERVWQVHLGTSIAAPEIRDAQVRAQQVRAVSQQGQLIAGYLLCVGVVPQIFQMNRLF